MGRSLITALIALLVLYAPLELTRVIILYGLEPQLIAEIVIIWTLYIAAIAMTYKLIKVR